ncbi:MAG: alpha/beta hydrolase [Variovorax paradoxus]|nr:MAG: alpha/beta hydrolase [Variovorax paradoxus]PZQ13876.1 MAG: alpha/beta hydrolase [Variovorax paradoxus]
MPLPTSPAPFSNPWLAHGAHWQQQADNARAAWDGQRAFGAQIGRLAERQGQQARAGLGALAQSMQQLFASLWQPAPDGTALAAHWQAYWRDATQRQLLLLDTLRRRGNTFLEHEAAGMPPVLDFKYEPVLDGATLPRPVNYQLLRVVPPQGVQVDEGRRPFMVVDPRAGHGAGIGGFKADSQVGEAFRNGHPVYFVAFRPVPEPGQTLADVRDAELLFLSEIAARHPDAPKPAVVGNCQGGWATLLLAASRPDLVGPVVINGAPMSYWAGKTGQNPMRYVGGLRGGALPALLLSDLGDGIFDGSALVANFEGLNPANSLFKKIYHLYANVDTEAERFLEFERWWGGFFLMTEAEIRWIVENLFVGNKLARGEAELGGERIDLRRIRSPIVVFASEGDNITPPPQALNWIADLYADADEIRAHGQRIVYMVHADIGHLGIFVSAKVAGREHDAITDVMAALEALPPGLYEMRLDDEERVRIRFEPREIEDILAFDDGRDEEAQFASVARLSELGTQVYETTLRPLVRAAVTPRAAQAFRAVQPLRARRVAYSDRNPLMGPVARLAEQARAQRAPVDPSNPFLAWERMGAKLLEQQLNLYRDLRDGRNELLFHLLYGAPAVQRLAAPALTQRDAQRREDLRALPDVRAALDGMAVGGAVEGTVRMLLLMAKARGYLRRSRLERLQTYRATAEFARMDEAAWGRVVYQQSIAVEFEPEQALATLPLLLDTDAERRDALDAVHAIMGEGPSQHAAAHAAAQELLQRFEALLRLPLAGPTVHDEGEHADEDTPAPTPPARPRRRAAAVKAIA